MSRACAALLRNTFILLLVAFLAACNGSYTAFESDVEPPKDPKTVDIKEDNAELISLGVYQSAFLAHYQSAMYDFLDANQLPDDALPTAKAKEFEKFCVESGTAFYSYTRDPGEEHRSGDKVKVAFDECVEDGIEYSGSLSATYSKVKGINKRFIDISSEQCADYLTDDLNISVSSVSTFVYFSEFEVFELNEGEFYSLGSNVTQSGSALIEIVADDIKFSRISDKLHAEILWNETELVDGVETISTTTALTFVISDNHKIIFKLSPRTMGENNLASIDGDQFYTVDELEMSKQNCQGFERTLSVKLSDFSTKKDGVTSSLNGSIKLFESRESSNRINRSIVDSDFTTTISEGTSIERYTMSDYTVEQALDRDSQSYKYGFDGFISNSTLFGGKLQLTELGQLLGNFDQDYPRTGSLEIKAKGLEKILLEPNILRVKLSVDYNGDSTGNSFSDNDIVFSTNWADLLARDFIYD